MHRGENECRSAPQNPGFPPPARPGTKFPAAPKAPRIFLIFLARSFPFCCAPWMFYSDVWHSLPAPLPPGGNFIMLVRCLSPAQCWRMLLVGLAAEMSRGKRVGDGGTLH